MLALMLVIALNVLGGAKSYGSVSTLSREMLDRLVFPLILAVITANVIIDRKDR
jgi:hypothetical protein